MCAAAGEAIALLYHTCGISDLESFLEDQDESGSSASPPSCPQRTGNQTQIPKKVLGSPATHMAESQQQNSSTITFQNNPQPAARNQTSTRLAASQAEAQPRQLSQDDSELATAGPSSRTGLDESSASAEAADAAAAAAHQPEDHRTNGHASASDAGPASSSPRTDPDQPNQQLEHLSDDPADIPHSNPTQHHPTPPTSTSPNLPPGAIGSNKEGNQGGSKTSARNPKQQAEAISNGLDDVVSHMKALATNKGDKSRRSRRDRATTRSTFRDLCSVVEASWHESLVRLPVQGNCLGYVNLNMAPLCWHCHLRHDVCLEMCIASVVLWCA